MGSPFGWLHAFQRDSSYPTSQLLRTVKPFHSTHCLRQWFGKLIKSTNTILYCRNWQETVEFYRTGLRLLVLSSNEWFVEFKLNEMSRISVANEARTSIKSSDGKGITISLQVADIEQTRNELIVRVHEIAKLNCIWLTPIWFTTS